MNLVPFECASDDEAREIAASDYNEFFVARVTGHKQFGTENITSKLYFTVEFDDGDIDSFVPLHDLLFVEEAKNYVLKHQPELAAALKAMQAAESYHSKKRIQKTPSRFNE
jgi:hypothetical protein